MVSEVADGIFMIALPFPRTRVKSINEIKLYVIKGAERNLIVDVGLNEPQYMELLMEDFRELGLEMENTDVFLTHMHPDHSGPLVKLKTPSTKVYAVQQEADITNALCTDEYWQARYRQYCRDALPYTYDEFTGSHPAHAYYPETAVDFTIVNEGDVIEVGAYRFRCIVTPGHSIAHTCLYDEEKKMLIGGDMILSDAAPILFFDDDLDNPLNEYLKSLDIVEKLDIETLLPGHGEIKIDVYKRIEEMRAHYAEKAQQIIDLLKEHGPMNAWQTAEYTTRTELPRELSTLSNVSKWFFYLPTCMTLKYLAGAGKIQMKENSDGIFVYSV